MLRCLGKIALRDAHSRELSASGELQRHRLIPLRNRRGAGDEHARRRCCREPHWLPADGRMPDRMRALRRCGGGGSAGGGGVADTSARGRRSCSGRCDGRSFERNGPEHLTIVLQIGRRVGFESQVHLICGTLCIEPRDSNEVCTNAARRQSVGISHEPVINGYQHAPAAYHSFTLAFFSRKPASLYEVGPRPMPTQSIVGRRCCRNVCLGRRSTGCTRQRRIPEAGGASSLAYSGARFPFIRLHLRLAAHVIHGPSQCLTTGDDDA